MISKVHGHFGVKEFEDNFWTLFDHIHPYTIFLCVDHRGKKKRASSGRDTKTHSNAHRQTLWDIRFKDFRAQNARQMWDIHNEPCEILLMVQKSG